MEIILNHEKLELHDYIGLPLLNFELTNQNSNKFKQ